MILYVYLGVFIYAGFIVFAIAGFIVYKEVPVEKVNSFLRKVILCSRIPDPSKWLFFFWLDNHERGAGCGGEDRIPRS